MGKKVRKKTKSGHKEKRFSSVSPRTDSQQSTASIDTIDEKAPILRARRVCAHVDKSIDTDRLSSKLQLSAPVRCEDCREGVLDRRASRGKRKQGKKKVGGSGELKSESMAIWICLGCGHFSCGGVGLPTTPQSHAVRHARQSRHPLAVQFENPLLRWCFPCNTLIPCEKSEENNEKKDKIYDMVRMVKRQPSEESSRDVEDIWFGSGSMTSEIKSCSLSNMADGSGGYVVRGLINLGNTCFFNSVTQNLLAIDKIRSYFLKLDECFGPLTGSLKNLFMETTSEDASRSVMNPKPLFASVCAKVPQFRGYQQHDSHELLRCMLDGLCTEELNAKKKSESAQEKGSPSNSVPTLIDALFGGQLSSTVTCLECGYCSVVFEPFLDLSLPVPTKKPPSKKGQAGSRARKPKLPLRRSGKVHQKVNKVADPIIPQSLSEQSASGISTCEFESCATVTEKVADSSGDSSSSVQSNMSSAEKRRNSAVEIMPTTKEIEKAQSHEKIDENDFTWMDYCLMSDDKYTDCKASDDVMVHNSGNLNVLVGDAFSQINDNWSNESPSESVEEVTSSLAGSASQADNCLIGGNSGTNDAILSCNPSQVSQNEPNTDYTLKSFQEETPLLVQDSKVLLLPFKEETLASGDSQSEGKVSSASAVGCDQETLEFDGFGDLFNEPEDDAANSLLGNTAAEGKEVEGAAGFGEENSSESDEDVVDDTNSPLSVDRCLAHFTKSELLTKTEHAWQCENCSKLLREQMIRRRKTVLQSVSKDVIHKVEDRNASPSLDSVKDHLSGNSNNGDPKVDVAETSAQHLTSHTEEPDHDGKSTIKISENNECNPLVSKLEEKRKMTSDSISCASQASSFFLSKETCNSCNPGGPSGSGCCTDKFQVREFSLQDNKTCSADIEIEDVDSDGDKMDLEMFKVKRDATKRILLTKAPSILTIHLKRFSQDTRGRLSKLSGHVDFKDMIDLKPFMDPRQPEEDMHKYRLTGVVEHLGGMRQGHYVAYVRGRARRSGKTEQDTGDSVWYYASDSLVREASLKEVFGCEAYILFYEGI